jgi:hypothetical protein
MGSIWGCCGESGAGEVQDGVIIVLAVEGIKLSSFNAKEVEGDGTTV